MVILWVGPRLSKDLVDSRGGGHVLEDRLDPEAQAKPDKKLTCTHVL